MILLPPHLGLGRQKSILLCPSPWGRGSPSWIFFSRLFIWTGEAMEEEAVEGTKTADPTQSVLERVSGPGSILMSPLSLEHGRRVGGHRLCFALRHTFWISKISPVCSARHRARRQCLGNWPSQSSVLRIFRKCFYRSVICLLALFEK